MNGPWRSMPVIRARSTGSAWCSTGSAGPPTRPRCTGAPGRRPAGDARGGGRSGVPCFRCHRPPGHGAPRRHDAGGAAAGADRRPGVPAPPAHQPGSRRRRGRRGRVAGRARGVRGGAAPLGGGRLMTRRRWALTIFAAWAIALAWLVKREYFRSTGAKLAEAALAVPPGSVFYRLAAGGQQVGYAGTTIDTTRDTIRVADVWVLDIPTLGAMHRTDARSTASVSRALRMQAVDVTYDGDAGRWHATARMVTDSALRLTLTAGGDSETTILRVARAPVLPDLLPLRVAFGGELKTGRSVHVGVFDPLLLAERDVSVTVAAESTLVVADSADYDSTAMAWVAVHFDTVRAFRLDQRAGGLVSSAWIDAQGHVVRAWTPGGFTVERTAFEIAYENFRHRDTLRLARATATPGPNDVIPLTLLAARTAPDPGPGRDSLRVRLTGVDVAGLELSGGGQALE